MLGGRGGVFSIYQAEHTCEAAGEHGKIEEGGQQPSLPLEDSLHPCHDDEGLKGGEGTAPQLLWNWKTES